MRRRLRAILALAAPTALVSVLQVFAQLFETWLAARQGTAALAGWAVVLPFALLMQMMSVGAMGGGVSAAIARALGGNRREEAAALVLHAALIALVAALLFAVPLALAPRAVLGLVGGRDAAEAAAPYAMWLFGVGALPAWLANTLASVLRGGGRHALAARVLLIAWAAYPPLAWLLVEPAGMGLAGLGAAFAAVFWVAALAMGLVVLRGGAGFAPRLRIAPSAAMFQRILSVGLVACGLAAIANLTTIMVTAQLAPLGPAVVAAYGISARLEFLMIPLAFGIGSALTALVGRAAGAGDWAEARRLAWTGGGLAFLLAGSCGLVVWLFPDAFARAFTNDAEVVMIAARALGVIAPAYAAFGAGMAMYFASQGAGRMGWPMAGAVARFAIAVGGGALLAGPMGLDGQFLAVALGITAYGVLTATAVRPGVWR
ncbi:multidrug transporter MatE [Falsiroseomonas bella]|uniref:Multidrug transporter MatE n=1 Tax=Falsiroseomonas bella TaxID=2184016 RepID=A0A317FB27_9PROT|nr:MATE family efflux transporter [Falsiroseomonas bella]PWS34796.1 multidrug transporter MatE [Falsiroseomonas bella]